jgi:RNA polymerase sigma-70 factor, ECF subfamily
MADAVWALGDVPTDEVVENGDGPVGVRAARPEKPSAPVALADHVSALVERARQSDKEAFGRLYQLYHGRVFRLARFHLDGAAEDVVAETFLRAWVALPRYRNTGAPFVAWLYGIARHVVADERAAQRRVEPRAEVPDRPTDPDQDDRLALAMAIERLPRVHRRVIELKFLIGLTNAEVAAALGKSVGAINTQQWRALRSLRAMMGER